MNPTSREWIRSSELIASMAKLGPEEFLSRFQGPFLIELPGQSGEARGSAEEGTDHLGQLRGKPRGEATGTFDLDSSGMPVEGSTLLVEFAFRDQSRRVEARAAYLGGHPQSRLGRGSHCDVQVLGRAVSRVHALIERAAGGGGWLLRDLGSSNGTTFDGQKVPANQPIPLTAEQVVQLGDWRSVVMFPRRLWEVVRRLGAEREKKLPRLLGSET